MTEDEALMKAREAYRLASLRFGSDRAAIAREIERQKAEDPLLIEALGIFGNVLIQGEQTTKH